MFRKLMKSRVVSRKTKVRSYKTVTRATAIDATPTKAEKSVERGKSYEFNMDE